MATLMAVNVGNSNTAIGVWDGESWIGKWRVRTVAARTPDDWLLVFDGLLGRIGRSVAAVHRTVVACVVPQMTDRLVSMVRSAGARAPLIVEPGLDTGIQVRIDDPAEIGADLLANAVAAYARFHGSCIAVDFGTALSLTAVSEGGELRGVAIAPGLNQAVRALAQGTAQLSAVPLAAPPTAIGTNTVHSIQSGIVFGYVGMVDHLVERMSNELPGKTDVVATGGQADVVAPLAGCFSAVDPWLTLEGLRLIAERNPD
jgi:type III pantothenate kinase